MKFLFDMTHIRILHTAATFEELLFDENNFPPHLANIRSFKIEGIDDPLFLGSQRDWTEINLRRLYVWMKLEPPLGPTKMDATAILSLRTQLRAAMAKGLRLEPSKLPQLTTVLSTVSVPPPPLPPRPRTASRGSVGPIIHNVATKMWEEAGQPQDVSTILQLRQKIMKVLNDEHSIKMTTSSNELGRWQKGLVTIKTVEPHI